MRHRWLPMLAVVALILVACGGGATSETTAGGGTETTAAPETTATTAGPTTEAAGNEEPIVFAASLPLTGMFEIPGSLHQEGYELCVDLINERGGLMGRPVELIVEDNRSDTDTTVNQYERFINADNADVLLGTFSTLLSFPASAIAEQAQMVFPEPSDSSLQSHSRGFEYNFGFTLKPINFIGQTPVDALAYYRDQGLIPEEEFPTTAAVVYLDDFFPNSIALGLIGGDLDIPGTDETITFDGYLNQIGMEPVLVEQFPREFTDWLGLANRIRSSGAEMLFALTTPPYELDIVRALETVDYQPKAAFYSQGTYQEFRDQLGDAADGIMVWSTWSPEIQWEGVLAGQPFTNQDFVDAVQEKYGRAPDEDHAQPFSVCQTMAQAIEATGTTDNTALRDWLASRTADDPARTIQGDYYWDDIGLTADRDVLLLQWQDGDLRFVYPRGDEFPQAVDLTFPMP